MQNEINDALQMLKDMDDENEFDNILHEARRLRFVSYLHNLPTPIRLAIIQVPIGSMLFFSFPAPPDLPKVALPIIWFASYSIALTIVAIFPRRSSRPTINAHWVKA